MQPLLSLRQLLSVFRFALAERKNETQKKMKYRANDRINATA
jgi:hypothetical protein